MFRSNHREGEYSLTGILTTSIELKEGGRFQTEVDARRNILFYVVNGEVEVNGQNAATHTLVEFTNEGEALDVKALRACLEVAFGDKKCQFFVETRRLFAAHTGGTGKKSNAVSAKKGRFLARKVTSKHALSDATLIFCHGEPYNEPIVAHGPFVMNSEAEIRQAITDYQSGKLGGLED